MTSPGRCASSLRRWRTLAVNTSCRSPGALSFGGDDDCADAGSDLDIIPLSSLLEVGTLHADVVAHVAELLIVEGKRHGPALEVNTRGDARWPMNLDV